MDLSELSKVATCDESKVELGKMADVFEDTAKTIRELVETVNEDNAEDKLAMFIGKISLLDVKLKGLFK